MILSNEPGYYKTGEYGIRIENLVLVEKRELSGAEREMMGFETLTFAPIDRHLVDVAMLVQDERDWLNSYHRRVLEIVGSQLQSEAKTRSEEHTSELQSLMRISYAVFCLKKKKKTKQTLN